MSVSDINTKVTEAVTAIEAADYATALTKLLAARALMSALPARSRQDVSEEEWDAARLDALIADVRRQQAAGKGIQVTKVTYARATD